MNKQLVSIALLSIISSISVIACQQPPTPLPEHLRDCVVKPTRNYICRDATPEEIAAMKKRDDECRIAMVRKVLQGETFKTGMFSSTTVQELTNEECLAVYNSVAEEAAKKVVESRSCSIQ